MSVLRPKDPFEGQESLDDLFAQAETEREKRPAKPEALTVTQAMNLAKGALEKVRVTVMGEVSEFNDKPGYKAAYFTLGDEGASMSCQMWRNKYNASGVELRRGMLVEVTGYFSSYIVKGRMQFMVNTLSIAGEGDLRLKVAQIARKLEAEGLMDPRRKRALPVLPERIGLVTSPRGKAVWDVIRTLRRRYPLARILFAGVTVEGDRAPFELARGLDTVVTAGAQMVLLVRGGGSYEDFMPFNDEGLARTVAACPVPVVTGIGHEPDNTICDMVADLRCSTPTAAAENSAPSVDELSSRIGTCGSRLASAFSAQMQTAAHRVEACRARPVFNDAHALLGAREQGIDVLGDRLFAALPGMMDVRAQRTLAADQRLRAIGPRLAQGQAQRTAATADRLHRAAELVGARQAAQAESVRARLAREGGALLDRPQAQVARFAQALDSLSPLAVLGRGYAVARDEAGRLVSHVSDVASGDELHVQVSDGTIDARVL